MKADGTKDFRVLAFTVPGIQLAGQWSAGKNVNDEEEPYINSVANGDVKADPGQLLHRPCERIVQPQAGAGVRHWTQD